MTNRNDVESFLRDFQAKKRVYGVVYADTRSKNTQTLLDLDIRPNDRGKILENLVVEDYCKGPLTHQLYPNNAWVFGVSIMQHDIYIKISMGIVNSSVICISFHLAEHPLEHPFKQ